MFSYISTAWVLPAFVGPPVAAFLTDRLGWPAVFWAVLPLLAVASVMLVPPLLRLIRTRPETPPEVATRPPAALWAAAFAALAAAVLQVAGQRLDRLGAALAVVGLALLAASLPNLMPPRFFRFGGGLPSLIVVRALIAGSFFGAEAFIPLMLVEQRGVPLVVAGGVLTLGAIGWTTGSWLQSRPSLPLRRDRIITLGTVALFLGLLLAAATAVLPGLWVGVIGLAWILGGLGMGLSMASTSLAVMTVSTLAEQGRNASSLQLGEALGASLLVGLAGSIFSSLRPEATPATAFAGVLGTMAAVGVVGLGVSLRVGRIDNELTRN